MKDLIQNDQQDTTEREESMKVFATGIEHLQAEMQLLDLYLKRHVMRLRISHQLQEDEMRGLYIADAQVDALLLNQQLEIDDGIIEEMQTLTAAIEQQQQVIKESLQANPALPLPRLVRLFDLSPFECQCLLMGVMPELDLSYELLYAYAQNDVTKKRPSIHLALSLFCASFEERMARLSIFGKDAPLLYHQLLHLHDEAQERESVLLARSLHVDRRIVDFLLERNTLDQRLFSFTRRLEPTQQLCDLILPAELHSRLEQAIHLCETRHIVFCLHSPTGVDRQVVAEAVCAALKRPLLVADIERMPQDVQRRQALFALLRREALLQGSGLYLAHCELVYSAERTSGQEYALIHVVQQLAVPVFLSSTISPPSGEEWAEMQCITFDLPRPDFALRQLFWRAALEEQGYTSLEDVAMLANQFELSGGQIRAAVLDATMQALFRNPEQAVLSREDLYAAARRQSSHNLRQLAQKVELTFTWDDIVLPPRTLQQLKEICEAVIYHHVVYAEWGFGGKRASSQGLNVLFAGSSGTGKTMAASIIAQDLQRDLYKIDLSSVVSKYIGETEKNLSLIFQEAQASNAILFFDEADALFGKRSEVKDAHDRYANIEVAYLLQKMEEYSGIVILATNLGKNIDDAFARRMQHVIEFPFPDATPREHIWRKMFPAEAPLAANIDFSFLARQFELTGGNIRNSVLAGALMAAREGKSICMEHLVIAVARELKKMGKVPSQTNFQLYYDLIRQQS